MRRCDLLTHERLERAGGRRRIVYATCSIASKTGIPTNLVPFYFFLISSRHGAMFCFLPDSPNEKFIVAMRRQGLSIRCREERIYSLNSGSSSPSFRGGATGSSATSSSRLTISTPRTTESSPTNLRTGVFFKITLFMTRP